MRIRFLSLLFFIGSVFGQTGYSNLENRIDSLMSNDFFNSAITSLKIFNLSKDEEVFSKNDQLLLRPASNQKIITALASYLYLDSNYTFNTEVYHTGEIVDSVCKGDLYIVGSGDPELTSKDLDSLSGSIRKLGIKRVEGNLLGDVSRFDSLYWGSGWMWDDNPYAYSPYLSALVVDKSSVKINYSPAEPGNPVIVTRYPETEFYSVNNKSVTTGEDTSNFIVTRDWINNKNDIIIEGDLSYKAKPDSVFRNISQPVDFFLTIFREKLSGNGIDITGISDTLSLPDSVFHLLSYAHPIDTVIQKLLKDSDNLGAEILLKTLGFEYNGPRASAGQGISLIDSLILRNGFEPENFRIADGSGLSFYNLISVDLLTELIKYFYHNYPDIYSRFYEGLPIAGIDGTLEDRMTEGGCYNNLRAKTGTLSGVSNLTGVLKSASGDNILFSIFIQNYVNSASMARNYQDRICKIIFEEL